MKPKLFFIAAVLAAILLLGLSWTISKKNLAPNRPLAMAGNEPIPPQFDDPSLFLSPIKQSVTAPSTIRVTGLTVPHHLLSADLMAEGFKFASAGSYSQILLLSPDHFMLGQSDISVSENDFLTVFGKLSVDTAAARKLKTLPFITNQTFFYREHGLGAELPFIKYYFPEAKIIALTFKPTTTKTELDKTIAILKKILGQQSLVIQSTDFSHYLPPAQAAEYDQQTLKVLQSGDPDSILDLNQPGNIDSLAAQYIQSRLQKDFFSSGLKILAHKNSQDYSPNPIISTTSYIVQAYTQGK